MGQQYVGEIRMVGFSFPPKGWALCNGQSLPINQNQALFALLGTTFGGNGQTTFLLPDMRGRVPMHVGSQTGGPTFVGGQSGGEELHTLTINEMPAHTHNAVPSSNTASVVSPSNNFWPTATVDPWYVKSPLDTALAGNAIANAGGGQGHENRAPYSVVNFIIALTGIFPSRN
jgi:microcystin-dependent protein